MNIPDDLKRYVQFPITLNPERLEYEWDSIHALPQAIPFLQPDGDATKGMVCLCIPSTQEYPYPMENNGISTAVDVIRAHGINFIWGRKFLSTRQDLIVRGRSDADDVYSPAAWAVAINQVVQEAHDLGAVGTYLDCEPSGDHPAKQTWKANGFNREQRERVIAAIMAAREQLGFGVDYCHPAGSSWNPMHYGYAIRFVADKPWTNHIYRLRDPSEFKPQPPEGFTADMTHWCSWIHPDPATVPGDNVPLTIEEFRDMDWDDIRGKWTDMQGVVLYASSKHLARLLAELGKGETG